MDEQVLLDGIQRGREAAQADRLHDAERCFLDALDASRGTFTEAELLACSSLVTLYSRENREFEALLMARRLDPIAVRRGELWHIAHARGAVCSALVGMQDWVRVKTALRGLEEVVAAVPEEKRAGHLVCLHGLRMEVLLQHREAGGARDLWNAAEPAFRRAESDFDAWRRYRYLLAGRLALLEGNVDDVGSFIERAEAVPVPAAIGGLDIAQLRVEWMRAVGDDAEFRNAVHAMLSKLEGEGAALHGYTQVLRASSALGGMLSGHDRYAAEAMRAFDLAASAVLSRIAQLDECVRRLPELAPDQPDDALALAESRVRFRSQQKRLLQAVGRVLEGKALDGMPGFRNGDFLRLCAWCESIRAEKDVWLPVGHYIPSVGTKISHTICAECETRIRA